MKCIICGSEVSISDDLIKCLICNLQWTLAEHKDNQEWAVRHIRALEAHVKELQIALDLLLKKLEGI